MPTAKEVADRLERAADTSVNVTQIGGGEWVFDFRLPVAADAPFKSSVTYAPDEQEITGAALRLSPDLLAAYDDDDLDDRLDTLLERTDPPAGGLWHTYVRGDAPVTGPHIMTPGDFSAVDPDEFVAWVRRLLTAYNDVFRMASSDTEGDRLDPENPAGNQLVDASDDTTIRFRPPHSKADAGYRDPEDSDFDADHKRCGDCVHFIEGGGCHFVQGTIRGDAYCTDYYADYGLFAHDHGDDVEINAELYSEAWTVEERDIDALLDGLAAHLQERREQQASEASPSRPETTTDDGDGFYF